MEEEKKKRRGINYKIFIIIPTLLFIFGIGILLNSYFQTGEWFLRSIDLKGGTLVTLALDEQIDVQDLEDHLGFDTRVRETVGFSGYKIIIETDDEIDIKLMLESLEDYGLDTSNANVETVGPSLGSSFWYQAQVGIMIAFILMGIVVFILFRKLVPSFAVIFAAVSDILVTLGLMQLFSIPLGLTSLAGLLMLIGYSVDTDILLTTRFLKGSEPIKERFSGALKTGLTMSLTSIGALTILWFSGISPVISNIALVLVIGLSVDIINTWLMNAGLLRWYVERKGVV
jgi:preprotein translocase subunit SecF